MEGTIRNVADGGVEAKPTKSSSQLLEHLGIFETFVPVVQVQV